MIPHHSKYPKKLYITNEVYRIKFLKTMNCFGECDPEKKEIRIKKGMSKRETFVTFIHECLHALEFEHNIPIKHKDIYKLEKAVYELLIDNFL